MVLWLLLFAFAFDAQYVCGMYKEREDIERERVRIVLEYLLVGCFCLCGLLFWFSRQTPVSLV